MCSGKLKKICGLVTVDKQVSWSTFASLVEPAGQCWPQKTSKGKSTLMTVKWLHAYLHPSVQTPAMQPTGHPAEDVPLQGRYEGLGQPGGVVQYTTVNINTDPPSDHIIWSLCCLIYSNICCLGLAAFIFSIKVSWRVALLIYVIPIFCYCLLKKNKLKYQFLGKPGRVSGERRKLYHLSEDSWGNFLRYY